MTTSSYFQPCKRIKCMKTLGQYIESKPYQDLLKFIAELGVSVILKALPTIPTTKPKILAILNLLDNFESHIAQHPPINQPMRFGNRAFQGWYDDIEKNLQAQLEHILPSHLHPAICELKLYCLEAFGNRTRIDFGSGHELSFCLFLYCLYRIDFLQPCDFEDIVLYIFFKYVQVAHALQTTYFLEPAGSRGVWGLDDYHFLPFLWGAYQLQGQDEIMPKDSANLACVNANADKYLYLNSIQFITKMKTGAPFSETSPMLYDISGIPDWIKVTNGLYKMYQGEVLNKLPIAQHIMFGSLFPFPTANV